VMLSKLCTYIHTDGRRADSLRKPAMHRSQELPLAPDDERVTLTSPANK
jgi:hypothetical protein